MDKNVLLRDLRSTMADLYGEALAGDGDAQRWLIEAFPGHEDHFLAVWPDASKPKTRRLTPEDFELLERFAWNIESRLLVRKLAGIVTNRGDLNGRPTNGSPAARDCKQRAASLATGAGGAE